MQFGVLLGMLFQVLVTVRAHLCEIDGQGAGGWWCRRALGCCLLVTLRAHFCGIGGLAVWGCSGCCLVCEIEG